MNSNEIRSKFLKYFEKNGHNVIASSPLVPGNDPTLLFTNAGMVQFKDVFLGQEKRPYNRATTSQRCVRAGGKHNDLENVGYTARHHTFFEMLGNFSFGDYFKKDAIRLAWGLLTEEFGLDPDRMWVTVYHTDDEAYDIWVTDMGVPHERVIRIGDKPGGVKFQSDNFWQMGDTGPCGPCSEIFWDHGDDIEGGPPGSPNEDGDRFIEIWNLVFMQFNRDQSGELHPLPKPSVDTGMGLERMAAVLQGVHSNYEIDMFETLIKDAASATGYKDLTNNSLKVIADHIRSCGFLVLDGVIPSNEGRGYVLRRIIRRAIRHGYKLDCKQPFFHSLIDSLVKVMGDAYPELGSSSERVKEVLLQEELRFAETLENGMTVLEAALLREDKMLDGETIFRLYDTFGFPVDLTADIAREREVQIDLAGFEAAMDAQRSKARAASRFQSAKSVEYSGQPTEFHGYKESTLQANVVALYVDGTPVDRLGKGEKGIVVLDRTPFYAESGGQIGDRGSLVTTATPYATFRVLDTQKIQAEVFGHHGELVKGELHVGDVLNAEIDQSLRSSVKLNHSATHILHAALRSVLGEHVQQKGSLVDDMKTRFDFSHPKPVTREELGKIELLVNEVIRRNVAVSARVMSYDKALETGAVALFGEKYGDQVRVIGMDDFSTELCGGTHVDRSGDIGLFKIYSETGVASGVRRIEAATGAAALNYTQDREGKLLEISSVMRAAPDEAEGRLAQIMENVRKLEKEVERLKSKIAANQGDEFAQNVHVVDGVNVLSTIIEGVDVKALRDTMDQLKSKLGTAVIALSTVNDGKVSIITGVTSDTTGRIKAGDLVNFIAEQVGGKGGGRPDLAQAGGSDAAALPKAMSSVNDWVASQLT